MKENSAFSDKKIVEQLRLGHNPIPNRIKKIYFIGAHLYKDTISGERYKYIPSPKSFDGRILGYSFEELTSREGDKYVSEIAEYSDDRSKDHYRINGKIVDVKSFHTSLSNRPISINSVINLRNTLTETELQVDDIFQSGNFESIRAVISGLKARVEAKNVLRSAVDTYDKSAAISNKWLSEAIDIAVEQYKLSEIFKEESNILLQRASLINYFSLAKENISSFKEKVNDLFKNGFFANVEPKEHDYLNLYLIDVFSVKGLNDVIDFLIKMKNAKINYTEKPIIKTTADIITLCAGITYFKYKSCGEKLLLDTGSIEVVICDKLSDDMKMETLWHELSHIALQPLNSIPDESLIETQTDDYVRSLLNASQRKTDINKK